MKKWLKSFTIILFAVCILSLGYYYLVNRFQVGSCVESQDGYIWHVNRYSFGEYYLMGWQSPWWGNEVSLKKGVLERKDDLGISEYHHIQCPTLGD